PRADYPGWALGGPGAGANVSLYNEAEAGPIYPTPVIGMVGELPDAGAAPGMALRDGDAVALIGGAEASLAGSELAKQRGELRPGLPEIDLGRIDRTLGFVRNAVR